MSKISLLAVLALAGSLLTIGIVSQSSSTANAQNTRPSDGWTLHIDAEKHFANHPTEIAHHWCKPVAGGLTECQLYDSDAADARLVGVETIVLPDVYKTFSAAEQANWHYHKTEISLAHGTFPDLSGDALAKTTAAVSETYGKVFIIFDPLDGKAPVGTPVVTIVK